MLRDFILANPTMTAALPFARPGDTVRLPSGAVGMLQHVRETTGYVTTRSGVESVPLCDMVVVSAGNRRVGR